MCSEDTFPSTAILDSLKRQTSPIKPVSETKQTDDLTAEEIKDVDEFYAGKGNKKAFGTPDEFIKWLNE